LDETQNNFTAPIIFRKKTTAFYRKEERRFSTSAAINAGMH
jgi:hypothetical protein